jgi:hypothetical protein
MSVFHRLLKAEAAEAGLTVEEYLLREPRIEDLPTLHEMTKKIRRLPVVCFDVETADLIRETRAENDEKWS